MNGKRKKIHTVPVARVITTTISERNKTGKKTTRKSQNKQPELKMGNSSKQKRKKATQTTYRRTKKKNSVRVAKFLISCKPQEKVEATKKGEEEKKEN